MGGNRGNNWTRTVRACCYAAALGLYAPMALGFAETLLDGSAWTGTLALDRSWLVLGINAGIYLWLGGACLFLGQLAARTAVRIRTGRKLPKADRGPGRRAWTVYGICCAAFLACVTGRNAMLCAAAFAQWDSPAGPLVVVLVGPLTAMMGLVAIAAAAGACVLGTGMLYLFVKMGRQMDMAGGALNTEDRNGY